MTRPLLTLGAAALFVAAAIWVARTRIPSGDRSPEPAKPPPAPTAKAPVFRISLVTRPPGCPVWVHRLDDGDPPTPGPPRPLGETPLRDAPFRTRSARVLLRIETDSRVVRFPLELTGDRIDLQIDLSHPGSDRSLVVGAEGEGALLVARREVTTDEYVLFLASLTDPEQRRRSLPTVGAWKGAEVPDGWSGYPVCGVDYEDAVAYCLWAGVRLPHEDEWERTAFGVPSSAGRSAASGPTWAPSGGPRPAGSRAADRNLAGHLDLAANLSEWVHPPLEPGFDLEPGLLKGGSFLHPDLPLNRRVHPEDLPPQATGFRVVETALPPGRGGTPPDPLEALGSPDAGIRISALAHLEPSERVTVDRVLESLGDPDLEVRRMAARALERFPIDLEALRRRLAEARRTRDPAADGLALYLLPHGDPAAAETIVDSFLSGRKGERLLHLLALKARPASVDLARPEVAGRLLDHLADLPAEDSHRLARHLAEMLAPDAANRMAPLVAGLEPERARRIEEAIDAASIWWTRLAAAHLEDWPPRHGIRILSAAIELDPTHAEALFHRGFLRLGQRAYDGSIADNTRAIEIDPEFTTAYNNRAAASFWSGRYEAVAPDAAIVIERAPGMPNPHFFRGAAAHRLGRPVEFLRDFRLAAEKDPDYLLRRSEQLIEREPGGTDALILRTVALLATGRESEASATLESLGEPDPRSPLLHYLRATCSVLERRHPDTFDALGFAQRDLGQDTLARIVTDDPIWERPDLDLPENLQRILNSLRDRASRK